MKLSKTQLDVLKKMLEGQVLWARTSHRNWTRHAFDDGKTVPKNIVATLQNLGLISGTLSRPSLGTCIGYTLTDKAKELLEEKS